MQKALATLSNGGIWRITKLGSQNSNRGDITERDKKSEQRTKDISLWTGGIYVCKNKKVS